jgi:tRNA (guanine-N7-)-methyltransferase
MSRGRQVVRLKYRPLADSAKHLLLDWESGELHRDPQRFTQLDSAHLFGDQKPLTVEIGPGSGDFLCDQAASHPKSNFLGIEVSHRAAVACAVLAHDQGLENVRVLRADFKLLKPLLPRGGWAMVYLHFPDPPQKNADQKRRIFDQGFLDCMVDALSPHGEISVATDKPGFLLQMLDLAKKDSRFQFAHSEPYLEGLESPVKSRFQLFWERKGILPIRFILQKRE